MNVKLSDSRLSSMNISLIIVYEGKIPKFLNSTASVSSNANPDQIVPLLLFIMVDLVIFASNPRSC